MATQTQPRASTESTTQAGLVLVLSSDLPALAMAPILVRVLVANGIETQAARAAVSLIGRTAASVATPTGTASRSIRTAEVAYRASYLLAAARRLSRALVEARSTNEPIVAALHAALVSEGRFRTQHLEAVRNRARAGAAVDAASVLHGPLLGWYLGRAQTHTPDCVAANGHNFDATRPPRIGWPGTVHVRCSCYPGAPHPGAATVDQATAGMALEH